jgi:AraC-like DNA-binding protein
MHEEYQLTVFDRGVGELTYRGKRELVGPPQVNVFAPGEVHDSECATHWELRSAYLSGALVRQAADQVGWHFHGDLYFPDCIIASEDLQVSFLQLFDAIASPVTRLATESVLLSALSLLFERFTDARRILKAVGREPRAVWRCRDFIESHYLEDVRLETLARVSGLSVFHLIRSFKRRFGIAPHAFQIGLRLNRAKAALRSGSTPTEAAVASGFFDQSHMHRYFRRTFGVTPNQYRRMACRETDIECAVDDVRKS